MCAESRNKRSPDVSRRVRIVALCTSVVAFACAPSPREIPTDWLSTAHEAMQDAWGAWVRVERLPQVDMAPGEAANNENTDPATTEQSQSVWGERVAIEGELIAVGEDSVFVVRDVGVVAIPVRDLRRILLQTHRAGAAGIAGWAVIGTLATATHGWYLTITAPMWIIGGTVASVNATKVGKQNHTDVDLEWPQVAESLRPFARFPAGLPPGLNRDQLEIKPAVRDETRKSRSSGW